MGLSAACSVGKSRKLLIILKAASSRGKADTILRVPWRFQGRARYLSVVHLKRAAFFFAPPSNTARQAGLR
jgi:hypothetical protein